MDNRDFGQILAQERKNQGFTQEELAKALYVTRQAISNWERGITTPDYNVIEQICGVLGMKIDQLMIKENKNEGMEQEQATERDFQTVQEKSVVSSTRKGFDKYHIAIGLGYMMSAFLGMMVFFIPGLLCQQPMVWAASLFGGIGVFGVVGLLINFVIILKRPE